MNINSERQKAKTYRDILKHWTNWYDQAWYNDEGGRPRKRNEDLEYRRNNSNRFEFRGPACKPPNLKRIAQHLNHRRKEDVLFFINSSGFDELLCLIDVDSFDPVSAEALAQYISKTWLPGRSHIEPSTNGEGRHIYFRLDIKWINRRRVWELLDLLSQTLKQEEVISKWKGAHVCGLYGHPTVWEKIPSRLRIWKRGSVVKSPFHAEPLLELKPLPVQALEVAHECWKQKQAKKPDTSFSFNLSSFFPEGDIGRTSPSETKNDRIEGLDGREKKRLCVTTMLRQLNRPITLEEALEEYETHYRPTGNTSADRTRRRSLLAEHIDFYNPTFKPKDKHSSKYAFHKTKGEYLPRLIETVPEEEFIWNRREKLNHQKLEDFLRIKLQDAFFQKTGFVAKASRDATIACSRMLKLKGLMTWVLTPNIYRKLLSICCAYGLLTIHEEHVKPVFDGNGSKVAKGVARMIGPGPALAEAFSEFAPIYEANRCRPAWLDAA